MAEAEETVSETFLVCWRRLEDVPDDALPWLLGVARRILANLWRGKHRREALWRRATCHLPSAEVGSPESTVLASSPASVWEGLAQLDPGDREILLLVAWDGLSYREAAKAIGCSSAAFATRLHRARKRLEKHMGDIRTPDESDRAQDERG